MRYGGHQTFTIRDGWLHKALGILMDESNRWQLVDDFAMDHLGVGRNMAKSINHWLLATGLARKEKVENSRGKTVEKKDLLPTDLASMIFNHDPYFMNQGTWWLLHVMLATNSDHAATWNWFLNSFGQERFQKRVCLNSLIRYEAMQPGRSPSNTTLERDLGCFLATYSQEVPSRNADPEEEIISPFVELGLMSYYRSSGYYNVIRKYREIPLEVFLFALGKLSESFEIAGQNRAEINFFDLVTSQNSPGRIFLLGNDDLYELLLNYSSSSNDITLTGMAGSHKITYTVRSERDLLIDYYRSSVVV